VADFCSVKRNKFVDQLGDYQLQNTDYSVELLSQHLKSYRTTSVELFITITNMDRS